MATNEAIILKTYALLLYLVPIVGKFPRDQKFLVGDRIENKVLDILDLFIEAYYSPKSEKARLLKSANIRLEQLRYLIRLTHDLRSINHEKYGSISDKIDEVGRMCGGWLKAVS